MAGSGGGSAAVSVSGCDAPATKKPEPRRATTDAFGREPVVSLDHRRFRDVELGGKLPHRGEPGAARERAVRYAAADERGSRLDARGGPIVHEYRSELYSQWIGTV